MKLFLIFVFIIISCGFLKAENYSVMSPDSVLKIEFQLKDHSPCYQVKRLGNTIINPSALGFTFNKMEPMNSNLRVLSTEVNQIDDTWTQVWGEKKNIRNNYNEMRIYLREITKPQRKMNIVFRVYDDGIGFRYEFPEQKHVTDFEIMDELTEFALNDDYSAWWIPAYYWNRYEYLYQKSTINHIDTVHTPLTMESEDGLFLSIHEAALTDYASMTLALRDSNLLEADLVPWSDGVKVKTQAPMKTPWRTIQIADTPAELITSYLILNLNEPNKLDDVSWIKPGKYAGIWWEMHLTLSSWGSGEKHGATTKNAKRYIDFASRHGFDGVLVEGWNVGWDGDWVNDDNLFYFTTPYPDFDIIDVTNYARERGVWLIGHHETGGDVLNYQKQLSEAFDYYNKFGINTIKTGYVDHGQNIKRLDENGQIQKEWHHGQYMVRHYRKVVELAAQHQIMLDVHEPIKDTGIRRTYPNMMTREGARGQEFNAWGPHGGNPPDHTTIIPFTRSLAGPFDYTPGIFDLLFEEIRPQNRVNSTLMQQLALYVVIFSPLHMAADLPENYEARPDAFKFIKDVPTDWFDTKVLHADIGNYITIVRKDRHSEDWYLGSITDEQGRILSTYLSFLTPEKKYVAEIYRDAAHAHWIDNPYDYVVEEKLVDHTSNLILRLAPGGGQAIRFRPAAE